MKFGELKSVAHNLADSLASGCSLLAGAYGFNVFEDAARSPGGSLEVNFLTGETKPAKLSVDVSQAISDCAEFGLPELCRRHGIHPSAFTELSARYWITAFPDRGFEVSIVSADGRSSTDRFGFDGGRLREIDDKGRQRRMS